MISDKIRKKPDLKLLCFLIVITIIIVFNFNSIEATSFTHHYINATSANFKNNVTAEKFTGLGSGTIQSMGLNLTAGVGSHVRVKIYDDAGTVASTTSTNNYNNQSASYSTGTVTANEFTGLPVGQTISQVTVNGSGSGSGTVRAKIYQDDGLLPHYTTKQFPDNGAISTHSAIGSGSIYLQKFTGLTPSGTITGLKWTPFATGTSEIRIKAYKDDGGIGPLIQTNNYHATFSTNPTGTVYATKFTGLTVGQTINSISLNATGCTSCFAEEMRVKVYQDDGSGGGPSTLLGESGSVSFSGVGCFPCVQTIPVTATIPASGNIWAAFEDGGTNSDIKWAESTGLTSGTGVHVAHTYGSGPSPFGTFTSDTSAFWMRTGYNGQINGYPKTLIYDGAATTSTAINQFGVNVTIPADGNVWLGYEANTGKTIPDVYVENNVTAGNAVTVTHTYGSGPTLPTSANTTTAPFFNVNWIDSTKSGGPKTLLAESGTVSYASGFVNIPVTATIPTSGNIWVATETSATDTLQSKNNLPSNTNPIMTHTYGTGPSPFGYIGFLGNGSTSSSLSFPTAYTNTVPWYRLTFTAPATTGEPKNLLGETGSITINSTGLNTFPFSGGVSVPVDGNVWVAFETDSTTLAQYVGIGLFSGAATFVSHVFGIGPNPFGTPNDLTTAPWETITFSNSVNVSFRPLLHDGQTQLTSGKLLAIQNGVIISSTTTNSTGWANLSSLATGIYNFTILDDKNFAVYKELNTNVASNISKTVNTYDTPFNCISSTTGYQSDFVLRINDTDGTHVTNITTPTCPNQNQVIFNMTFTGNGQSGNTFSSSMITTVGVQAFEANPKNFTVSGTIVPTTFTGGNNIISNSFSIGSGLVTTTKQFIITLTTTQATNAGTAGGTGQNYFTTNQTCFAGVFDPTTNTCVFGTVNISIANTTITTNPNQPTNNNIGIACDGTGSVTVTSINLGNNNLGVQVGQLPVTVNCGQTPPNTCPQGTTLTSGVCIAPLTCPIGSQTSNGQCVGQLICPDGTTLQNQQCIAQPTCPTGSVMVNNQCVNNGIPITIPPTPSECSLLNPVACVTTTTQSQDVVVTATTSDGKIVTAKTVITAVQNPELNNVSLVIIFLILAAVIAGLIYRHLTRKQHGKRTAKSGNDKSIKDFNRNIRKS